MFPVRWSTGSMRRGRAARGLLAILAVVLTSATASASAATNLVGNGTFEGSGAGSLTGWGGSNGSLSLVAGNGGGHAAKLTASSGASSTYAYTTSKPVKSAVAGTAYQLSGDVQSSLAGQSVCLVLKEIKSGHHDDRRERPELRHAGGGVAVVPAGELHGEDHRRLADRERAREARRRRRELRLRQHRPADRHLRRRGRRRRRQPPSVPTGVTAAANGPTSVTVSWTPSTDDIGVAGYDVYRDGTPIRTVGGSQTSFTDTTVQPSTTYAYTVDAFDAVPNTSAQSSPPAR